MTPYQSLNWRNIERHHRTLKRALHKPFVQFCRVLIILVCRSISTVCLFELLQSYRWKKYPVHFKSNYN